MNLRSQSVKEKGSSVYEERVVTVAVKASHEIPRTPLVWALTHIIQPGDCVKLLVVIPTHTSSKKWGFPRLSSDCSAGYWRSPSGTIAEQKEIITDLCSQMMLPLHDIYDLAKIKVKIKVVFSSPCGAVADEAKRAETNWVILDKRLKKEVKPCMKELECNVVMMKRSQPKVLRLNLVGSPKSEIKITSSLPSGFESSAANLKRNSDMWDAIQVPNVTPATSPEEGTSSTTTDVGMSTISSLDLGTSPFSETNWDLKKKGNCNLGKFDSDSDSEKFSSPSTSLCSLTDSMLSPESEFSKRPTVESLISRSRAFLGKSCKLDKDAGRIRTMNCRRNLDFTKNVREVISLSRNAPSDPPPLCSMCKHKAPLFGKPPRWFTYAELEYATGVFAQANFLAEGGFGSVYRGVLPDGQVIAVKQYKSASSQGDREFCSEVEVLSCAQHRNVVMLIGYCVEDKRRLLVYEYICNGSLDSHLYANQVTFSFGVAGRKRDPLTWCARQKIAVGAARGLRYLHEECRVGCIVHRDMRPNNILLTHDFEPLVGDFGLARWQPDGDLGVDTRIIGRFGYLAPEYAQSGQITEKADVYSFGVVLVELVTGRKAVDINRPRGQQSLTEWARPLLEKHAIQELVDPYLRNCYSEQEVLCMLRCASLCIRRDPILRPRMSQVLRILEGDIAM